MRKVYTARTPLEAHIVRGLMESRGIEVSVRGEILFSLIGEVPATPETLPSIWVVNDEDAETAGVVLEEFRRDTEQPGAGPLWRCPRCGERVEPQFTECWRCTGR